MSQQKILNTLQSVGFSSLDAQVYLFLGKKGPKKVSELVQALNIPKQQVYVTLKNLQSKGVINASLEHPARFSTEPFEKVLDLFVKARMEEVQQIQSSKSQILSDWQLIKLDEEQYKPSRFKVLEGNNYIYPKLKQMIEEAKTQLLIVLKIPELLRISQNEAFEEVFTTFPQAPIKLKILTDISPENVKVIKSIFHKKSENLEIRAPDLGLKLPNSLLIRDEDEVAFLIDSTNYSKKENTCLWTNCRALVQSFTSVFDDSWHNSTDIFEKMVEIKTGRLPPKTNVIRDADQAQQKYQDKMASTQKSIYIITSPTGLIEYWKDQKQTLSWIKKGIYARIMAPITNENLQATKQLMKFCEVKHVEEGFIPTTIIDKQHLFQFSSTLKKETKSTRFFENTFYTNDPHYIEKMENMLDNIWENAQSPSPITLQRIEEYIDKESTIVFDEYRTEFKKILGVNYQAEPQQGKISEKYVIEKIMSAERVPAKDPNKDTLHIYNTMGTVLVYPNKKFKLPNMLFQMAHANKNSSFGEANTLTISIQTNIVDEQSYLQTVFMTDNAQGYEFRKAMLKNQYNTEAVYLLNKDELTIQVSANSLFAGWTVPIPLLSQKYLLPPANLIFKGSGKTRTYLAELKGLMNRRVTYEFNCLEAFVTFMLPFARYYSPATDGLLYRECIITSYPPTA